jgi:hypothetical protein
MNKTCEFLQTEFLPNNQQRSQLQRCVDYRSKRLSPKDLVKRHLSVYNGVQLSACWIAIPWLGHGRPAALTLLLSSFIHRT